MTDKIGSWRVVFDSVVGTSHLVKQIPCQDSCRVVVYPAEGGEVLIVACADGAGSATHSDRGSQIACDQFVDTAIEFLQQSGTCVDIEQDLVKKWLFSIQARIAETASAEAVALREMATTLLGAIVFPEAALFIQIGDGAMIFSTPTGFECAFWPHSGEYANTTNFLTSENFAEKFEWRIVPHRIDELVAFTDGLERLILQFQNRSVFEPAILPMLKAIRASDSVEEFFEPLREFLDSSAVNERTDDDKTLVIGTRIRDGGAVV